MRTAFALVLAGSLAGCAAATTPGGGTSDGAASSDASSDGARSDGGGPAPRLTIRGPSIYADCQPSVPSDPLLASWTVDVTGATGATATFRAATLTLNTPRMSSLVQTLTVDVPAFTLHGGNGTQDLRKSSGSPGQNNACERCGNSTAHLSVTFDIDGYTVTAETDTTFGCAF